MADVILAAGLDVDAGTGDVTIDKSEVDVNLSGYYYVVSEYTLQKLEAQKIIYNCSDGVVSVEFEDQAGAKHTLVAADTTFTSLADTITSEQSVLSVDLTAQDGNLT